ncbi:hypothetical protein NEOLI_000234 [Neolecta irregularis DAH-3]|uniref:Uncharacterized protein n=1 Tax=Neolecta irregularis (strain DAH-3) TaxID=1198029 RepID=A0A1U7LJ06_NEOID|nr:hypothetical protein NEOLI_000234 [Neolecta irregularis DAH-3]|eukprot:OLL22608.1 hypothetical protein NEOLI_000234 [Neolecta irregularis DAH-3]
MLPNASSHGSQARTGTDAVQKPQETQFSTSAQHRASVLALGSISHLQHHFARSGIKLTGTLGQYKKQTYQDSSYGSLCSSPEPEEEIPRPPTPKQPTYIQGAAKSIDPERLRARLDTDLEKCRLEWSTGDLVEEKAIDLVTFATFAIRSARAYSTQSIPNIMPDEEKAMRTKTVDCLGVLRRIAERDGKGGVTADECNLLLAWVHQLQVYLRKTDEETEERLQTSLTWIQGDWTDRELDRYHLFLLYFDPSPTPIPSPSDIPAFLDALRPGLRLCLIHNACTRRSRRPFGYISRHHLDTKIRYRATENLSYWRKAIEERWDVEADKFSVREIIEETKIGDAMLLDTVKRWCQIVINEISGDLNVRRLAPVTNGEKAFAAKDEGAAA